jgi:phosphotriesterase-related protein
VHIVASTGMGPEEDLGGYFLTPQTDPPTPWPAEKFADLFSKEVTEGMVVPRLERRGSAGLVATTATRAGMTPTDESLFRGAARTALATGVPVSIRYGADALRDLRVVLDEGLPADRVVVGDLDRRDAVEAGWPLAVTESGAYVVLDHVGLNDDEDFVTDEDRAGLVAALVGAGHANRVLLSGNAIGVAKGQPAYDLPYAHVQTAFVPLLASRGVADEDIQRFLVGNPRDLLAVR